MTADRSYRWLFWLLAGIGLIGDLASKYYVFASLHDHGIRGHVEVIPGAFHIVAQFDPDEQPGEGFLRWLRTLGGERQPHVNRGALFGLGQGNNLVFGIVSVAAAGFIIFWSARPAARHDIFLMTSLGFILGGTLGNLYDRIVFQGVRDFLHWFKWYDWPVFNIADVCLVIGAGMLLLEAFFRNPPAETA